MEILFILGLVIVTVIAFILGWLSGEQKGYLKGYRDCSTRLRKSISSLDVALKSITKDYANGTESRESSSEGI